MALENVFDTHKTIKRQSTLKKSRNQGTILYSNTILGHYHLIYSHKSHKVQDEENKLEITGSSLQKPMENEVESA